MNSKSTILFAMAAAAFAQTNMKVRFGDGTGLDIHTESTGSNLPVSTSGSHVVPAGFDYHRVVFDKQGALLLVMTLRRGSRPGHVHRSDQAGRCGQV